MTSSQMMAVMTATAAKIALTDREFHLKYGSDLNPFSTGSARATWQQGWEGIVPPRLQAASAEWRFWQRGRQARILADADTIHHHHRGN